MSGVTIPSVMRQSAVAGSPPPLDHADVSELSRLTEGGHGMGLSWIGRISPRWTPTDAETCIFHALKGRFNYSQRRTLSDRQVLGVVLA